MIYRGSAVRGPHSCRPFEAGDGESRKKRTAGSGWNLDGWIAAPGAPARGTFHRPRRRLSVVTSHNGCHRGPPRAARGPLRVHHHALTRCPKSVVIRSTCVSRRTSSSAGQPGSPPRPPRLKSQPVIGRKRSPLLVLACADLEPGSAACRTSSCSLLAP